MLDIEMCKRMKVCAVKNGRTAEAIGDKLGVSPSTIRSWWCGRRGSPSPEKLIEYANACGVTICELMGSPCGGGVPTLRVSQIYSSNSECVITVSVEAPKKAEGDWPPPRMPNKKS